MKPNYFQLPRNTAISPLEALRQFAYTVSASCFPNDSELVDVTESHEPGCEAVIHYREGIAVDAGSLDSFELHFKTLSDAQLWVARVMVHSAALEHACASVPAVDIRKAREDVSLVEKVSKLVEASAELVDARMEKLGTTGPLKVFKVEVAVISASEHRTLLNDEERLAFFI